MHGTFSRALLALLAALAMVAAACETDDTDDPLVEESPEEEPAPAETPEEEPIADAPGLESDEDASVVELLAAHDDFSEFVSAIEQAGLEAQLSDNGPFTVFAPTDEGFAVVPDHEREQLAGDLDLLEQRVLGHVVDGEVMASELVDGDTLTMLDGTERHVLVTDAAEILIGSALVIEADTRAANGLVHAIDFVLPSSPAEPEEEETEAEEDEETDDEDDEG